MIELYPSKERGVAEHGWLLSYHSFSFADYYNPKRMGFGLLRVINEDYVEPAQGFGTHGHDNMEIITIVLEGELEHKDSQGNHGIIRPGDVQRMSAGSGIRHSEFNASQKEKVHLLQIWVHPKERGIKPGYEQKTFPPELRKNKFLTVATGQKTPSAVYLHQNSVFSLGTFDPGKEANYHLQYPGNGLYAFVIEGKVKIQGATLSTGDAAGFSGLEAFSFVFENKTDMLLIEVPLK